MAGRRGFTKAPKILALLVALAWMFGRYLHAGHGPAFWEVGRVLRSLVLGGLSLGVNLLWLLAALFAMVTNALGFWEALAFMVVLRSVRNRPQGA